MENEIMFRKLVEEIIKLQNKNRVLKSYLHILVSKPESFPAQRIRFVSGEKANYSIIQLN